MSSGTSFGTIFCSSNDYSHDIDTIKSGGYAMLRMYRVGIGRDNQRRRRLVEIVSNAIH
jgi:hypothetical protein